MAEAKTTRYMTPLKYKDGAGVERTKQVHFELDPIEFMDWTINNPFDANELQAGLAEIEAAGLEEKSRDLTREEVTTMMNIIKILVQISAGKPSDDNEYFHKDKYWTDSYAYRGFRTFLLSNPREMNQFLKSLLDNNIMAEFTANLAKANEEMAEATAPRTSDSDGDTVAKMEAKLAAMKAQQQTDTPS